LYFAQDLTYFTTVQSLPGELLQPFRYSHYEEQGEADRGGAEDGHIAVVVHPETGRLEGGTTSEVVAVGPAEDKDAFAVGLEGDNFSSAPQPGSGTYSAEHYCLTEMTQKSLGCCPWSWG
jgi:hypothetical protein